MPPYRPEWQSQFGWGTEFDSQNCTMACGAMLLDRQTTGRIVTNAPNLRRLSGVGRTPDGTSMTDVARAIKKGYDITIQNPGPFETFKEFEAKVRSGRGAIIAGDCAQIRGRARCPGDLSANHALYVNEVDEDGNFLVYDPAERTAQEGVFTLSRRVLRRYAANWSGERGMINAAYSRKTALDGLPDEGDPDEPGSGGPLEDLAGQALTLAAAPAIIGTGVALLAIVAVVAVWYLGRRVPKVIDTEE